MKTKKWTARKAKADVMSQSYHACLAYLYELQSHGVKLGLETIRNLLAKSNHPERKFTALHIGGTNGKGSTAAMTASVLRAANVRVGLYTSPHLIDFRERIQVQGEQISESRVVDLVRRFQMGSKGAVTPTFFETTTAMAFQYFAEEKVDVAVLEVGMGGRFDATNVCCPSGVLITNVALDHEAYLGDTLEAIAYEKSGIIKAGVPVVVGPMETVAHTVIQKKAQNEQAPYIQFGSDFSIKIQKEGVFDYQGPTQRYLGLVCALNGVHQCVNAACALALLEQSVMPNRIISQQSVIEGLGHVLWEGRLETVKAHPLMICDGAHNPPAAKELVKYLQSIVSAVPERKLIILVAMMRDKHIEAFLSAFLPLAKTIICTQIDHSRSATVEELQSQLPASVASVYGVRTPTEAVDLAKRLADENDVICVTGSLFLVGAVKSVLTGSPYVPLVG